MKKIIFILGIALLSAGITDVTVEAKVVKNRTTSLYKKKSTQPQKVRMVGKIDLAGRIYKGDGIGGGMPWMWKIQFLENGRCICTYTFSTNVESEEDWEKYNGTYSVNGNFVSVKCNDMIYKFKLSKDQRKLSYNNGKDGSGGLMEVEYINLNLIGEFPKTIDNGEALKASIFLSNNPALGNDKILVIDIDKIISELRTDGFKVNKTVAKEYDGSLDEWYNIVSIIAAKDDIKVSGDASAITVIFPSQTMTNQFVADLKKLGFRKNNTEMYSEYALCDPSFFDGCYWAGTCVNVKDNTVTLVSRGGA